MTAMGEELNEFRLMEPALPRDLLSDSPWWPWIAAAVLAVMLLAACWWLIRRKSGNSRARTRDQAWQEAMAALEQLPAATARETAVRTSLILRRFLARAAGDRSLFETHEEFISRHDALQPLTADCRERVTRTFTDLAAMKYAPEPDDGDSGEIVRTARSLLEQLHQQLPE